MAEATLMLTLEAKIDYLSPCESSVLEPFLA